MWDILHYSFPGKSSQTRGQGLFHPSFRQDMEEEDDNHTVETQIFHHPTREVDMSDGGQALPPHSDLATSRTPRSRRSGEAGQSTPPERRAIQYASTPVETALWPGPVFMGNNAPIMDITQDPFFQFQDQESQYLGLWEIGNL